LNRHLLITLVLLILPFPLSAGEGDADRDDAPTPLDRGVVRIEIMDVMSQDVFAYYAEDTLYLPFLRTCDLLRIPAKVSRGADSLQGEFPSGTSFLIDRTVDSAWIRGRPAVKIADRFVRLVSGKPYVEYSLFFSLLGITAHYDWRELKLSIDQDERLPVVRLYRNRQQYQALSLADGRAGSSFHDTPSPARRLLGSPIVDWNITGTRSATAIASAATLALGAEVLFGSLQVNLASTTGRIDREPLRTVLESWRWKFVTPSSPLLRELEIGGSPTGTSPFYDLRLTNVLPGATRSGTYDLTGRSGPGFAVELYEGTRLVSVTTADSTGFYSLPIPIGYGTVNRTIRYVSPFGESRTEDIRLQLDPGMLPAGRFDYALNLGTSGFDSSALMRADAQLALGITDRVTLGLEATLPRSRPSAYLGDSLDLAVRGTFWIGNATSARIDYSPSSTTFVGIVRTTFPSNLYLGGSFDSLSPRLDRYTFSANAYVPLGHLSIGARGIVRKSIDSRDIGASGTISGYVSGFNLSLTSSISTGSVTAAQRRYTRIQSLVQAFAMPVSGVFLTSTVGYDHTAARISDLGVGVSFRLSRILRLGVEMKAPDLSWANASTTATLQLDLSAARVFVSAGQIGDTRSTSITATGSAMIASDRLLAFPDFSVGGAVVTVRAFEDRNSNGRWDDDEPSIAPPRTELVRDAVRQSERSGIYDHLTPFQTYTLVLDRWDHADRSLYPLRTDYPLFTSPTSVSVVEIPYAIGFDVTGRCRLLDSSATNGASTVLHGLRALLVSTNGTTRIDAEIYSDGNIYAEGVPPGTYRIEFDGEQLDSRRVEVVGIPSEFELTETSSEIPEITFRRR